MNVDWQGILVIREGCERCGGLMGESEVVSVERVLLYRSATSTLVRMASSYDRAVAHVGF